MCASIQQVKTHLMRKTEEDTRDELHRLVTRCVCVCVLSMLLNAHKGIMWMDEWPWAIAICIEYIHQYSQPQTSDDHQ